MSVANISFLIDEINDLEREKDEISDRLETVACMVEAICECDSMSFHDIHTYIKNERTRK